MALFEKKESKPKAGYSLNGKSRDIVVSAMKGEVLNASQNTQRKIPGEPHPFDYTIVEGICNQFGLVNAFVEKLLNQLWGSGFTTKSENPTDKELIDTWIEEVSFAVQGRDWCETALKKGTAYLELSGKENEVPTEIKCLNPDRMYIERDKKGVIKQYNQAMIVNGKVSNDKYLEFKPHEIACLRVNPANEDAAYGGGIITPNLKTIENFLASQRDMHDLIRRKANAPLVAYLGNKEAGEYADPEECGVFGSQMQYMNNRTEWAVSSNVKLEVIDFGDVGKNFETVLRSDMELLMYGFQTPEVLLGQGNIPEGLAGVQMDAYERYVRAYQKQIERIIEDKIFKRILRAHGRKDGSVQFVWGQPGKDERNAKIGQLTTLLGNLTISQGMRIEIEKQLADLLEIDVKSLTPPEKQKQETETRPQPKVPGSKEHAHAKYEGVTVIGRRKNAN